jgi:hypothetical protein
VLTAGHLRSTPVEALAELLRRRGTDVAGVIAVSVFQLGRARALLRQRGMGFVRHAARRALGWNRAAGGEETGQLPLAMFLAANGIVPRGLRRWCDEASVPLAVVSDLNAKASLAFLRRVKPQAVVYGGGGILRVPFIEAAGRVLNAHAGPLPAVRGMNAAEWSLLLGEPAEATIHLIDSGIDTGSVLLRVPYERNSCHSLEALRERAVVTGLEGLLRALCEGGWDGPGEAVRAPLQRQCFVMAPVLREIVASRLAREERRA